VLIAKLCSQHSEMESGVEIGVFKHRAECRLGSMDACLLANVGFAP